MSKTAIVLLILIFVGPIYFPDTFQWIWLIICFGFFAFLVLFHLLEKLDERKLNKNQNKEG